MGVVDPRGEVGLLGQLYFEGDPHLATDPWVDPDRTVCLVPAGEGMLATFDLAIG